METKPIQRRYDLDWLRVLAFSGVFFYHCSRFFNTAGWHIKNAETSAFVDIFTNTFDLFGMPLIFAISGASIFFALRPGGASRFLRERVLRLLVPLALGILVLAPPQVYLDRLTHGKFSGSFFEFIPQFFQPANFAWTGVHLWYLEYLFVFTLVLLPLFIWLKRSSSQSAIKLLSRYSMPTGAIFLWAVPIALVGITVDPFGLMKPPLSEALLRLVMFPLYLIYGYLIYADECLQQTIIRQRRLSLVLSIAGTIVALLIQVAMTEWGWKVSWLTFTLVMSLASLLIWSYLLMIFGYGMRYLTANKRLLSYANEAVLPFYILHQPVILGVGYFIISLQLPILAKYLIITPLALGITLGLFEYGVRRVDLVRQVFGLKTKQRDAVAANLAALPTASLRSNGIHEQIYRTNTINQQKEGYK
ncbi:MAG TPA: acyltransferase family protein [Anaerolineales bacterium]